MGSACGSLFGSKQTTQQDTSQQSSGQTTSNFLPQLQQAFGTLQNQYANLGSMSANPWQTGAADAQMGVADNLQPAYGAAGNVATSGIGDVSRYMSPYISNVVDATRADFAAQNARDLSNVNAQAARTGALTGTGAAAARNQAMESQRRTQDATIANLYNQGFQQSGQLAQADASARLAGANSIGSLVGANSGANATLGSLGQGVFQSNLAPYTLANQYASGVGSLANAAGQSVTSTSTGSTSETQEGSQGLGTIGAGLLGAYLMGRKAHGGAVTGDADGNGIMDRYEKTLASLHRMHGGSIPTMADGGVPDFAETQQIPQGPQVGMPYEAPQADAPRMDLGGPQPQAFSGFDFGSLLPSYDHGVWRGEKPSSMQTIGYALTQIGKDNPFSGFGSAAFNQYNEEARRRQQRDMQAKQLAQQAQIALGKINGQPTLTAQQLQEQIRQHNAEIALKEKQLRMDGIKINPVTGQPYSSDPQSQFYPKVGTGEGPDELELIARKEAAKKAPENWGKAREEYSASDQMVSKLTDFEALMPHMVSGSFAGAELEGRKMLARLGFGDPNKVAATEIGRALTQQLVLDATKNLRPATDLDLKFTQKATATIESDPSTLPVLIPGIKAAAERSKLKAELEMESWRRGRMPDTVAIDKYVDSRIPSPYQTYARQLELGRRDGPAGGPRVEKAVTDRLPSPGQAQQPRTPPQPAIGELLQNANDPRFIESFNRHFNGGRPGLAESIIAQQRNSQAVPQAAPNPMGDLQ